MHVHVLLPYMCFWQYVAFWCEMSAQRNYLDFCFWVLMYWVVCLWHAVTSSLISLVFPKHSSVPEKYKISLPCHLACKLKLPTWQLQYDTICLLGWQRYIRFSGRNPNLCKSGQTGRLALHPKATAHHGARVSSNWADRAPQICTWCLAGASRSALLQPESGPCGPGMGVCIRHNFWIPASPPSYLPTTQIWPRAGQLTWQSQWHWWGDATAWVSPAPVVLMWICHTVLGLHMACSAPTGCLDRAAYGKCCVGLACPTSGSAYLLLMLIVKFIYFIY